MTREDKGRTRIFAREEWQSSCIVYSKTQKVLEWDKTLGGSGFDSKIGIFKKGIFPLMKFLLLLRLIYYEISLFFKLISIRIIIRLLS